MPQIKFGSVDYRLTLVLHQFRWGEIFSRSHRVCKLYICFDPFARRGLFTLTACRVYETGLLAHWVVKMGARFNLWQLIEVLKLVEGQILKGHDSVDDNREFSNGCFQSGAWEWDVQTRLRDGPHLLDSLSSVWDRPIRSMECRGYVTAHLLDNLSATWERSKISNDMI